MLILGLTQAIAPPPPYRREATVTVMESSYDPPVAVSGATFYVGKSQSCAAYQLPQMSPKWEFKARNDERVESLLSVGSWLYAFVRKGEAQGRLVALNSTNGKEVWSMPCAGANDQLAYAKGRLYASLRPRTVSSIDVATRRVRWTAKLDKPSQPFDGELERITVSGNVAVLSCDSTTYGVDVRTGKVIWTHPKSYLLGAHLPVLSGVAWVPSDEGSVGIDVATGRIRWSKKDIGGHDFADVLGSSFVGVKNGLAVVLDPILGTVKTSARIGPEGTSGGNQSCSVVGGRAFIQGLTTACVLDSTGKSLWTGPAEAAVVTPFWTDGRVLIGFDGRRLMRYVPGQEDPTPETPEGKRQLAEKLIANYDNLDNADKLRIKELKDDAFEPLLRAYINACLAYDKKSEGRDSYGLYSKYHDLGELLTAVTTAQRSNDLMAELESQKPGQTANVLLLTLLADNGDPAVATPFFLRELDKQRTPAWEMYESTTYVARSYIVRSKDPRAVAFVLKHLQDKDGDPVIKGEGYWNLAGTGGKAGFDAVVALRSKRTLLPSLSDRALKGFLGAGEFGKKMKPLATKKSPSGKTWSLLESGVLGSSGDLWLAEEVAGVPTRAQFVGVSTHGVSRWAKPPPPEPTFTGKTAKQLVSGDWLSILVGNPLLSKDSDADGLTDLAEKRLGTNPNNPDTDGDGDRDELDPCPNAAGSPTTERQQIVQAVFEARYHFAQSVGPALLTTPEGVEPFDIVGRQGPVIWHTRKKGEREWSLPLEQCYEQGVAFIGVTINPPLEKGDRPDPRQPNLESEDVVVGISTYFGGLNGTGYRAVVRKIEGQWVVITMWMAFVS